MNEIQFIPKTNVDAKEKETHHVGKNGETTGKEYKLNSVDDTSMFENYYNQESKALNISDMPGGDKLTLQPDDVKGDKISETKNNDGTYTITYKTENGTTQVTGKKSGVFGIFGFGKISNNLYTISEYDNNGKLTCTTEKSGFNTTTTTLYDESGNKDFSVSISGSSENTDYAIKNGKLATDSSISLRDYNPDGSYFEESFKNPKSDAFDNDLSDNQAEYVQRFYDSNGNEISRDEYMKMNNLDD